MRRRLAAQRAVASTSVAVPARTAPPESRDADATVRSATATPAPGHTGAGGGTDFTAGGDTAFLLGPYEELLRVLQRDQTPV